MGEDGGLLSVAPVVPALLAAAAYGVGLRRAGAERSWPWHRTACWLAGVLAVLGATTGPLEAAADRSFVAHAVAHVLLGMLGPLLLVCGAPVTLALRALPVSAARRLSRLLRRWPVRLLTEPVVAAVLAVGGLWLLYQTSLYTLSREHPGVHALVHLHLLGAGLLLASALVSPDPMPHRRSARHRATVLVATVAGHDILAKLLYASPPADVEDGPAGAMVMYYAGDAVEVTLMVLLCASGFRAGWSAHVRRRSPRSSRRVGEVRAG